MCNSELFSSLIQRHGSHKLLIKDNPMEANRCDNPANDIDKTNKEDEKRCCDITKDGGIRLRISDVDRMDSNNFKI